MAKFAFNPRPVVTWPVHVNVPQEEGGIVEQVFTAKFLILPRSEREANALEVEHNDAAPAVAKFWIGWGEDLIDLDGKPIPFSEEIRDELLQADYLLFAVNQAYVRCCAGIERKN